MDIARILNYFLLKLKHYKHRLLTARYHIKNQHGFTWRLKWKHILTVPIVVLCLLLTLSHMDSRQAVKHAGVHTKYVVQVPAIRVENQTKNIGYTQERTVYTFPCQEQKNIVYIKAIKCASETLTSVFRRFGYERNLSFMLPPEQRIYLAWPYPLVEGTYRESKTGNFNILCEHIVYDRERLQRLMPPDTVYITSVREPFSQFKSLFHYYNLEFIMQLKSESPVKEYLLNISRYEAVYKSSEVANIRYCVPDNFSMTQNLMSFNLGLSPSISRPGSNRHYSSQEVKVVTRWLDRLQSEFTFVIVVEYFVESLILLRRKLCWTWKDIFFLKINNGSYAYKDLGDPKFEAIYKSWSKIDYLLYNRFNDTLWKEIKVQKSDFFDEVKAFKTAITEGEQFCGTAMSGQSMYIIVPYKNWSPSFYVTWSDCQFMLNNMSLLKAIKVKYEQMDADIDQPPVPSNMTKVC